MRNVRRTINQRIIDTIMQHPGEWLSTNEITKMCGISSTQTVGKRLQYLTPAYPHIMEQRGRGSIMYRYAPEDTA